VYIEFYVSSLTLVIDRRIKTEGSCCSVYVVLKTQWNSGTSSHQVSSLAINSYQHLSLSLGTQNGTTSSLFIAKLQKFPV